MSVQPEAEALITDAPEMAHLATSSDDRPHVAPVWYLYDDGVDPASQAARECAVAHRGRKHQEGEYQREGNVDRVGLEQLEREFETAQQREAEPELEPLCGQKQLKDRKQDPDSRDHDGQTTSQGPSAFDLFEQFVGFLRREFLVVR